MITWIHTADLHLDAPLKGWRGTTAEAGLRLEDYRATFERIVQLCQKKQVTFLFIAGDFLEHGYVQPSTVAWVQEQLRRIPETKVLISPGNHDPYRVDSFYDRRAAWPDHVKIFGPRWERVVYDKYDLTIIGRGFADYKEPDWIAPPVSDTKRTILLVHGTYMEQVARSDYFPITKEALRNGAYDYVALGHIHKAQLDTLKNHKKTKVCYPGSPEALSWKETGERKVIFGQLDDEVTLTWIPIHCRTYEVITCDVGLSKSKEELKQQLVDRLSVYPAETTLFTVKLVGRCSLDGSMPLFCQGLQLELKEMGYRNLWIDDETEADVDLVHYKEQGGLVGRFIEQMEQRMNEPLADRAMLTKALAMGMDYLLHKEKR